MHNKNTATEPPSIGNINNRTAHSPWWFHHCADRRLVATREATPAAAAPKASRTAVEWASLYDRRLNFEDHAEARDVPTVVGVDGENGWPGALIFDRRLPYDLAIANSQPQCSRRRDDELTWKTTSRTAAQSTAEKTGPKRN
nr:hypothetical protein Iba_chr01aCG6560 [Ipomoea batatas]